MEEGWYYIISIDCWLISFGVVPFFIVDFIKSLIGNLDLFYACFHQLQPPIPNSWSYKNILWIHDRMGQYEFVRDGERIYPLINEWTWNNSYPRLFKEKTTESPVWDVPGQTNKMNKDTKIFMREDKLNFFEILCISGNFWQVKRFYIVATLIKFTDYPDFASCVFLSCFSRNKALILWTPVSRISLKRKVAGLLKNNTRITD